MNVPPTNRPATQAWRIQRRPGRLPARKRPSPAHIPERLSCCRLDRRTSLTGSRGAPARIRRPKVLRAAAGPDRIQNKPFARGADLLLETGFSADQVEGAV